MKPFDPIISSAYVASGLIWEWSPDSEGPDLGTSVCLAWKEAFGESLDLGQLPEPYDMLAGDLLYALPQGRFLFINGNHPDASRYRASAEIRATMPLYWVENNSRIYITFNALGREAAIDRLTGDLRGQLPPKWRLFERARADAEPQLVLQETNE